MDARTEFGQLVQQVAFFVGARDLDAALAADLNDAFGYGSEMHDSLGRLIHAGAVSYTHLTLPTTPYV